MLERATSFWKPFWSSALGRELLLFSGLAALALLMSWSRTFPLDALERLWGGDLYDHGQMVWNLWHSAESVLNGSNPLFSDLVFYPVGASLAGHTGVVGFFPVAIAVKLFSGNAPLYPVFAYQLTRVLCFSLLLYFMFKAVRAAGYGVLPALVAAVGFAFGDFFFAHWLHLNHLAAFFLPLVAWLSIRLYREPSRGRLLSLAAAMGTGIYFTELSLFIVVFFVSYGLASLLWPESRAKVLGLLSVLGLGPLLQAGLLFGLIVAPFLQAYAASGILPPEESWFDALVANLMGYVIPSHVACPLYGELFQPLSRRIVGGATGWEIFLGFPLILFGLLSLAELRRPHLRSLWVVALAALALSLGTTLRVFETDTGIPMPYAWLVDAPLFGQNRSPVRLGVFVLFCFAFFAAAGLDGIRRRAAGRVPPAALDALLVAVLAWTLLEVRPPPPGDREPVERPAAIDRLVEGPVMHVPFTYQPGNQAFYQTLHGQPITYGYLARKSRRQLEHVREFEAAIEAGGARLGDTLERHGIENVFVTARIPFLQLESFLDLPVNVVLQEAQPRELVAVLDASEGDRGARDPGGAVGDGEARWLRLPRAATAKQIDILAGANDHYLIELHRGPERVAVLQAKPDHTRSGLSWRALGVARGFQDLEFDRIRVGGRHGDGRYEIATIVVSR